MSFKSLNSGQIKCMSIKVVNIEERRDLLFRRKEGREEEELNWFNVDELRRYSDVSTRTSRGQDRFSTWKLLGLVYLLTNSTRRLILNIGNVIWRHQGRESFIIRNFSRLDGALGGGGGEGSAPAALPIHDFLYKKKGCFTVNSIMRITALRAQLGRSIERSHQGLDPHSAH